MIFYLKGLCPVEVPMNGALAQIEVLSDPTSPWIAIPGLMIVATALLVIAARSVRHMEVSYGE